MKLENQVVSLELSKQLKEAGYEQEGLWWWSIFHGSAGKGKPIDYPPKLELYENGITEVYLKSSSFKYFVAPTVAELGERLPDNISSHKCNFKKGYFVYDDNAMNFVEDTEANARAKMWLYLKKEGKL